MSTMHFHKTFRDGIEYCIVTTENAPVPYACTLSRIYSIEACLKVKAER